MPCKVSFLETLQTKGVRPLFPCYRLNFAVVTQPASRFLKDLSLKAVLFDHDGVLVDSMPFHVRAWQLAFAEREIALAPQEVLLSEGSRSVELAAQIFKRHDVVLARDELNELVARKQALYRAMTRANVSPGTRRLLSRLKQTGLLLGLVTGSALANVKAVLPPSVLALFDAVVTGDDVAVGKPNPTGYLAAAKGLGVEPEACLVVENAPLGIEAARRAGMRVAGLTTTLDGSQLEGADYLFRDLQEMAESWEQWMEERKLR